MELITSSDTSDKIVHFTLYPFSFKTFSISKTFIYQILLAQ
ncbi:hypothetical protein VIBNISOn1_1690016 [Vibrio nigripulchritudo SOn1]|uniref:Uncharacterized protein n=1 Tax=Vibrio nigripulchritudo SOn1 TaxID=1238450 RepID=A0AAV2VN71_9VIBR|nr:hypothetical protein VIBNISOn1_1690016 [Vibrio nigripulchritudo SOn1]